MKHNAIFPRRRRRDQSLQCTQSAQAKNAGTKFSRGGSTGIFHQIWGSNPKIWPFRPVRMVKMRKFRRPGRRGPGPTLPISAGAPGCVGTLIVRSIHRQSSELGFCIFSQPAKMHVNGRNLEKTLNPVLTVYLMAMAINQAETNEDAASRVGQRLPLNVCTVEGLRSQCSLAGLLQ